MVDGEGRDEGRAVSRDLHLIVAVAEEAGERAGLPADLVGVAGVVGLSRLVERDDHVAVSRRHVVMGIENLVRFHRKPLARRRRGADAERSKVLKGEKLAKSAQAPPAWTISAISSAT